MHAKILRFHFKALLLFSIILAGLGPNAWAAGQGAPSIILPKLFLLDTMEIGAAQMAEPKACHRKVREYAHKLGFDHAEHREVVSAFGQKRNLDLNHLVLSSREVRAIRQMRATLEVLSRMTTCDFDSDFLKAMIDAHEFAIQLVQSSMTRENDAELRQFLRTTLQALRMHKRMAITLWNDLEKNGGE